MRSANIWACCIAVRFEVCGSRFDWIWFNSISQSQAAGEKHSKTTSDRNPDNLIGDSCIKYGFRLVVQICFQLTLFQVCSRSALCKNFSFPRCKVTNKFTMQVSAEITHHTDSYSYRLYVAFVISRIMYWFDAFCAVL